jgi:hypothetical protein
MVYLIRFGDADLSAFDARHREEAVQARTLLFLSLLLSIGADASEGGAQNENYCHDDAMWAPMEALLKAHPDDTLVIRGYAMRLGLCRLIDDGKVSLETGIKLFELERQRAILERLQEQANRKRQKALPDEDREPLG